MIKVGINGLGRIGRLVLRIGMERKEIKVVAVNSRSGVEKYLDLIKNDSVYGRFCRKVEVEDGDLVIDGEKIAFFNKSEAEEILWREASVEVVVESTGKLRERKKAEGHLKAGAERVIISAPGKDADATIVMGVNEDDYDSKKHFVISGASCTTNCLGPVIKILDDNFGVLKGMMATVHSYTNDQNLVDGTHKKDPRRARAAGVNIIPTTTGASKAVGEVVKSIKGKVGGLAYRVPVICGSVIDLVVETKKKVNASEVNRIFLKESKGKYKGIVEYSRCPLVSSDIIKNTHSAVFDSLLTEVIKGNLLKVVAWYDNEWGYTSRLLDLVELVGKK